MATDDLVARLREDARHGFGAGDDWSDAERADYWAQQCSKARRNAAKAAARIEALEAQLAAREAGWLPIESAPRDGKPLLLFARCKQATASAPIVGWHLSDLGWIEASFSSPVGIVPTHWMPLPAPPNPASNPPAA